MKKITWCVSIVILICSSVVSFSQKKEKIQIAILLDTSSSMDGLIDQARTNLWKIINETAKAKKDGVTPDLEVALYEYGNDGLSSESGFIRLVTPLTDDLDRVSDDLFKLRTNGGNEYCGMVIDEAVKKLSWDKNNNMLKMIYIAGNEEFFQGNVDYKNSVKKALSKGVTVNTIYCGSNSSGINEGWKDGADRGEGSYMSIDQDQKVADIRAPQDAEILSLNEKLNNTYIAFGSAGEAKKEMQAAQDSKSKAMANDAAVQRAIVKTESMYSNSGWDLVDASNKKAGYVANMREEDLPAEMKKMSVKEREKYVENKRNERTAIQAKIQRLSEERQKYVEKEMIKQANDNTLDSAMIKSIRKQAQKKGYTFDK